MAMAVLTSAELFLSCERMLVQPADVSFGKPHLQSDYFTVSGPAAWIPVTIEMPPLYRPS
jgi:hypothetical protein